MAEIWGAAIAVGGAAISAYASNKAKKDERKAAKEDSKAASKDEAIFGSAISQFEAEQEDYYSQLNRNRKQRGLDQFRQFSTLNQFAPNYGSDTRIEVGDKPSIVGILDGIETEQKALEDAKRAALPQQGSGGGKSLLDKIDPLGAAIGKKDPVRKALSKLF